MKNLILRIAVCTASWAAPLWALTVDDFSGCYKVKDWDNSGPMSGPEVAQVRHLKASAIYQLLDGSPVEVIQVSYKGYYLEGYLTNQSKITDMGTLLQIDFEGRLLNAQTLFSEKLDHTFLISQDSPTEVNISAIDHATLPTVVHSATLGPTACP